MPRGRLGMRTNWRNKERRGEPLFDLLSGNRIESVGRARIVVVGKERKMEHGGVEQSDRVTIEKSNLL